MSHTGKKLVQSYKQVENEKFYPLEEAIKLAKETSYSKFVGSIDLAIKLNLDVRKAEQQLRGAVTLPHGNGRETRVLVATDKEAIQKEALANKADIVVGKEDLISILQKEEFNFDIIVTEPEMMGILGKYGRVLGPKGLMPNPKMGTINPNPAKLVVEIKKGKANYRTDKNGIVHVMIGKANFDDGKLVDNANTIISLLRKLRPASVKGNYFQTINVSATMGPAIKVQI